MYQVIFDISTKNINLLLAKEKKIVFSSFKKLAKPHSEVAINYFFDFLKEKRINFKNISEIVITQLSGSIIGNIISFTLITCWKNYNEKTNFFIVDSLYLQLDQNTKISAFNDLKKKYSVLIFNQNKNLFEKRFLFDDEFLELINQFKENEIQIDNQRKDFVACFFANANKYKKALLDDYFCFRG